VRSRPRLKIAYSGLGLPGQPLSIEARFHSKSDTPVDFLDFRLEGGERNPQGHALATRVSLAHREPARILTPGEHRFRVRFDLPPNLPPTYRGTSFHVGYDLFVHVSIPWWPDLHARYEVPVAALPAVLEPESSRAFCNDELALAAGRPYIEASFESRTIALGDSVAGVVSFSNVGGSGVRSVRVELRGVERPSFGDGTGPRYWAEIHRGPPPEGRPIPFRVRMPERETGTFAGAVCRLDWSVAIQVLGTWGPVAALSVPLRVYATAVGAPLERGRVVPVGRDRQALVFSEVARRSGLAHDVEAQALRGGSGDVNMEIRVESRGAQTVTVAHYRWPPLGLDLDVGEADFIGSLLHAGAVLPVGPRLTAYAREKAQVEAWLVGELFAALGELPSVRVRDEGATVEWEGGAQGVRELDHFVTRAQRLLVAFARANATVPPPALGAAAAPAWRAFAERTGGRFVPGPMAVQGALVGTERCTLEVAWADATRALATRATLALDPPLDAPPHEESATLSPLARDLLRQARAFPDVVLDADRFGFAVPGLAADPAELEPRLLVLARLARAARGLEGQGPFR
jgi:hypothetical protein